MAVSPWTLVTLICSELVEKRRKGASSSRSLSELLPPENLEVDFEDQVLQQRGVSPSLPQLKVCGETARGQIETLVTIHGKTLVWVVN